MENKIKIISRNIIPNFFHTPTIEEQSKLIKQLEHLDINETYKIFLRLLKHDNKYLRLIVIEILMNTNSYHSLILLRRCLLDEEDLIRKASVVALKNLKKNANFRSHLKNILKTQKVSNEENKIISKFLKENS